MIEHHSSSTRLSPLFIALAGASVAPFAHADLNNIPGMNGVQTPTAALIQGICGPLNALTGKSTQEQQLADACRAMVQTSNDQQGVGPTAFSLGLSEDELKDGLQAVAPEEANAFNQGRTVSASGPIGARLLALRNGTGGAALAQSGFSLNGRRLALADLLPEGSRGGGASADAVGGSPWGGFVNGHYTQGSRDSSSLESGFDFNDAGLTAGVDYRFSPSFVAGAALNYASTSADFDHNLGDVESDNYGLSVYSSYNLGSYFIDGFVSYTKLEFDSKRNIVIPSTTAVPGINTAAKASPDADQYAAAIGGGYDWAMGDLTVTPFVRLNYLHLKVDGYTESEPVSSLGLTVGDRSVTSLQSVVGGQITKAISTSGGVISPYGGVQWIHEFRNDSSDIKAKYTYDPFNTSFTIPSSDPDRNYFLLRGGVTGVFANGISAFANIETAVGLRDTDYASIVVGARVEF
jgi:uncharacterized protein with beta-barrel porin domain